MMCEASHMMRTQSRDIDPKIQSKIRASTQKHGSIGKVVVIVAVVIVVVVVAWDNQT
jgi:t-SNARE complex subunit (syntaxin)